MLAIYIEHGSKKKAVEKCVFDRFFDKNLENNPNRVLMFHLYHLFQNVFNFQGTHFRVNTGMKTV